MTSTNIKQAVRCPKCLNHGVVKRKEKQLVAMECPECKKEWKTYSKMCKDCGNPNGYVVDGPCTECYSQKYRSS